MASMRYCWLRCLGQWFCYIRCTALGYCWGYWYVLMASGMRVADKCKVLSRSSIIPFMILSRLLGQISLPLCAGLTCKSKFMATTSSLLTDYSRWSTIMHWILAVTNACNALKYVTRFPCDIFGFYVAFIYLQKGIQVLTNQGSDSAFYLSVMVALLVLGFGYLCGVIGSGSLFQHYVRMFIKDYGIPLAVIFFTRFVHSSRMTPVELETLPTSTSFAPTTDRDWFIHFWDIGVAGIFIALPFAILLTILFYYDHNARSMLPVIYLTTNFLKCRL